jgi:hypothetical protein
MRTAHRFVNSRCAEAPPHDLVAATVRSLPHLPSARAHPRKIIAARPALARYHARQRPARKPRPGAVTPKSQLSSPPSPGPKCTTAPTKSRTPAMLFVAASCTTRPVTTAARLSSPSKSRRTAASCSPGSCGTPFRRPRHTAAVGTGGRRRGIGMLLGGRDLQREKVLALGCDFLSRALRVCAFIVVRPA